MARGIALALLALIVLGGVTLMATEGQQTCPEPVAGQTYYYVPADQSLSWANQLVVAMQPGFDQTGAPLVVVRLVNWPRAVFGAAPCELVAP